jgi:signal peptidase
MTNRPRAISTRAVIGAALLSSLLTVVLLTGILAVVLPAAAGAQTYTILTSSMKPGLPPGTFVVVERQAAADLHVGDVITFQLASGEPEVVTHRIVKVMVDSKGARTFVTQGDSNAVADSRPVRAAQIRGKVWYAIPFVGWIAGIRSTSVGLLALSIVGWSLLVVGATVIVTSLIDRHRRGPTRPRR